MSLRIDDRYFEWLYSQFGAVSNRNPARSHWELAKALHSREFFWFVSNDDNRVGDGLELRHEFLVTQGDDGVDREWLDLGCSTLEMLVALARRASFETDREPGAWIWEFFTNLGMLGFTDVAWNTKHLARTQRKLDQLIYRTYSPTGRGGLFPLQRPAEDQRKVELWYQMSAYLIEKGHY